jgi:insertion element IS1 protein InsB
VLALCRRTRQVVAYWLGDRSETSAVHVWEQLPYDYARCHSFSDKWEAPHHVFDHKRHRLVNKDEGKPTMSNAGSIPYDSGWGALPVKL